MNETWTQSIVGSFQSVVQTIIEYLPAIIAGIIILIVGVLVASALARLVEKVFSMMGLDGAMSRIGVTPFLQKIDERLTVSSILAGIVKWSIIIATILAVSEILGLEQLTEFMGAVLSYIPNVLAATAILLLGIAGGRFIEKAIAGSIGSFRAKSGEFVGTIAKWAVVVFSFMMALTQLGIAPQLINTLVAGFIGMIAIAGGLAFGLGGRDLAKDVLSGLKNDLNPQQ